MAAVADAPRYKPIETAPSSQQMAELHQLIESAGTRSCCSAAAAGRPSRCRISPASRRLRTSSRLHVPTPDALFGRSPFLCGRSRSRREPEAGGAHQGAPIWCWLSAPACRRSPANPTRCSTSRRPSRNSCMSIPDAGELGRVYQPASCHQRVAARLRGGARRAQAARVLPPGARHRRRRMRIIWPGAIPRRSATRAPSRWAT